MKTCKTCRWWGEPEKYVDWGATTARGPLMPEAVRPHRKCACPLIANTSELNAEEASRLPSNGAQFSDYEGYDATFRTGPDFGCIHHEERK